MPEKKRLSAIEKMKRLLYKEYLDENIPFQLIWDSFETEDEVPMDGGVQLFKIERDVNPEGKRFITVKGIMPKGSTFPYNLHEDAFERFMVIVGTIRATHIPIDLYCCRGISITKGVRHAFESLTHNAEFIAHIVEEK